ALELNDDFIGVSDIRQSNITKEEVIEAMRHLSPYKAQGPDNIYNQMLKNDGNVMIESLVFLFGWKKANIMPIPKPDRDHNELLLRLTETIHKSFDCNSVTYAVLLDISAAYDSIWRNRLKYKMRNEFKLDGRLYWWIDRFLSDRLGRV
ncbi:hypothetical protein RFI_00581, partial [Reticulomyxa filosa]